MPIGLSIMLGGGMALTNGAGTPVTFYDDEGKHQYDLNARSSPNAQIILAVTYTLGFKPKDSDGDGVPDNIDKCPTIPQGLNGKDGCPNPIAITTEFAIPGYRKRIEPPIRLGMYGYRQLPE